MTTSMTIHDDDLSFSDCLNYHLLHEKRQEFYLKTLENYIERSRSKNITIVDFGTCDGGNIIPMFKYFIQFMQANCPEKEITLVFNDHCENDFKPLIQNIKEFQNYDKVHIMLNVGNVYEQCLPSCNVDVGFCLFVLNYLSKPIPIKNGLFTTECTYSEFTEIRQQAVQDWTHFLMSRCSELKPGGVLIVILPFYKMYGNPKQDSAYHKLTWIYKQMLEENIITQEEFERTFLPIFTEHTIEDLKTPFINRIITRMEMCDLTFKKLHFEDVCPHNDKYIHSAKVMHHPLFFSFISS